MANLVVMAAGIGSRYGAGIKQLAKLDDNGYTIIDYSIYDAIKSGFDKVVFIIRKEIEKDFKEIIGDRMEDFINVSYVYQSQDLPGEFISPEGRTKPWGTVPALLAAKDEINEEFLVINADDYYGKNVFKDLYNYLENIDDKKSKIPVAMPGYKLSNTLSANGTVTRGVSLADSNDKLLKIIETHEIIENKDGSIGSKEDLDSDILNKDSLVSMNMWASTPEFIKQSEKYFLDFLESNKDNLEKAEYVLPVMVDQMLKDDLIEVTVLPTNEKWIGITYKEDLKSAQDEFKKLLDEEIYPKNIWE